MKYAFSLAAILTSLLAASAFGGDGNVPQSTLEILGLADMEIVSDEAGMEVRGMGGGAATRGHSHVFGVVLDPNTNSHVFGVDANSARASLEATSSLTAGGPSHTTASVMNLPLSVTSPIGTFNMVLIGGAGGSASASVY